MLLPLQLMWNRVHVARDDADTTLFLHLLYLGEMVTKLTTAGIVAAISDDRERHRYSLVHSLIRSDGLGDWVKALDEALIGPASQHLLEAAGEDRRSLTEKFGVGNWQYESVKGFKSVEFLASSLAKSPMGGELLFVFDNFETVTNPADLFRWLDTHIRLPNKILITSRSRDFKADFPIDVTGMTESEADQLMDTTASRLGISNLLTHDYKSKLFDESDGHPYIMKVLLGEVAKAGKLVKVERIVAGKDEILDALFERTYAVLSPVAISSPSSS